MKKIMVLVPSVLIIVIAFSAMTCGFWGGGEQDIQFDSLVVSKTTAIVLDTLTVKAYVSGSDANQATYNWFVTGGNIVGGTSGSSQTRWAVPEFTGTYQIKCEVSGTEKTASVNVIIW